MGASSNENTDLVEHAYDAFARGDIPAILAVLDPDVVWHVPETVVHGGTFKGPDEVLQFFQGVGAAWSRLGLDIEGITALGDDQVVGIVGARGTRSSTGAASGYGTAMVFTIREGKIVRFREFVDLDDPIA